MKERESFIFYNDWIEPIERAENPLLLYRAITAYGVRGEEPTDLPPYESGVFLCIKLQIDRLSNKYEDICEKRREAGRKGGLARVANMDAQANQANQANASKTSKFKHNDNDNDNDNDNEPSINEGSKEKLDKKKADAISKLLEWVKGCDSPMWFETTIRNSRVDTTIQSLADTFVDQVDVKTAIMDGHRAEMLKYFQRWIPTELNKRRNEKKPNQELPSRRNGECQRDTNVQKPQMCKPD